MRAARTSSPLITITPRTPSRMPIYAITPRRSVHNYHPFAPFVGSYGNACVPRVASPFSVPSLFKGLEEDLASLDALFNNLVPSRPAGAIRSFSPRFDVREEKDAFHLTGEIPGVEPSNLSVEFVDRNTMVVKGRTVQESQRGNKPSEQAAAAVQDKGKQKAVEDNTATAAAATTSAPEADAVETEPTSRPATPGSTDSSSNYRAPTVEATQDEDNDFVDVAAETAADKTSTAKDAAPADNTEQQQPSSSQEATTLHESSLTNNAPAKDEGHNWVSERTTGSFSRSFRFPGHIDQENVKAALKDGVLRVVVPKVQKQAGPRRINIE